MSYYTVIFPDTKVYDKNKFKSPQEIDNKYRHWQDKLEDIWLSIMGYVYGTPTNVEECAKRVKELLDMYEAAFTQQYYYFVLFDMWNSEDNSISVNHYQYNRDPQRGIDESKKFINMEREAIVGLACMTPTRDILPKDSDYTLHGYLQTEMLEIREAYDDFLHNLEFSKLCVDYWDTHEEG